MAELVKVWSRFVILSCDWCPIHSTLQLCFTKQRFEALNGLSFLTLTGVESLLCTKCLVKSVHWFLVP
jgi:hypothetical protein